MSFDAKTREQVRLSLLRILDAGAPRGFSLPLLAQMIRAEGFNVDAESLRAELSYLRDKNLVETVVKQVSPEIQLWRITAFGRDVYAEAANEVA